MIQLNNYCINFIYIIILDISKIIGIIKRSAKRKKKRKYVKLDLQRGEDPTFKICVVGQLSLCIVRTSILFSP